MMLVALHVTLCFVLTPRALYKVAADTGTLAIVEVVKYQDSALARLAGDS